MLAITIAGQEFYDEDKEEFFNFESIDLELEHSLISLSKWESIHNKPFLGNEKKTTDETLSYVECMILTKEIPEDLLQRLTYVDMDKIQKYIASPQSATTFGELPKQNNKAQGETITAELIYYWMVAFNIPFECEAWHLNRLFALVKICGLKNAPPKKMSRSELAESRRSLNAQRKAQTGTKG